MRIGDQVMTPAGRTVTVSSRYVSITGQECARVRFGDGTEDAYVCKDLVPVAAPNCPPGSKYDSNKPDWSLLQWKAVDRYARVLTFGATKYDRDNWKLVPNLRRRYLAACLRHIVAYVGGEETDAESGEHHLAHAICCLAFILEDIIDKGDEK